MWFKLGETDFTSYITAIMAAKPDFMFGAIAGKDAETFMQQAQARWACSSACRSPAA